MNTPICDFVKEYIKSEPLRLHMPGHKGNGTFERYDITEIENADSLFEASGIIKESEQNASSLFGCHTFYSTEGSSLAVRAMLYLAVLFAKKDGKKPLIMAERNVHKSFVFAAAMLGFDILWADGKCGYMVADIDINALEEQIRSTKKMPDALYITSPDYLGNEADIKKISEICRKYNILLLVDNAHGAYLKFLEKSRHPIDLGADMCCDSAHKTLPVLTGGAYLHIAKRHKDMAEKAKDAMALFASTSPSYLILQSLDRANLYLSGYKKILDPFVAEVKNLRKTIEDLGFETVGTEELKITVKPKSFGYTGNELYHILKSENIVCEFSDPDYLVMMFTPEISKKDIGKIKKVFSEIKRKEKINILPPELPHPQKKMSVREAAFEKCETVKAIDSENRVLAFSNVMCPPAVPIVVGGEIIDAKAVKCFEYYKIDKVSVIKE